MPTVTDHAAGTFCWPELYTNDQLGMKRFYGDLFGWKSRDIPVGPNTAYTVFTLHGADAAGCSGKVPNLDGMWPLPPHWMSYIAVRSADAAAQTALAAGGTILQAPFDIPASGRMAALRDPTGAIFCVWEDRGRPGIGVVREPGALYWTELLTTDTERAARFYETVFGWQRQLWPSDAEPQYHLFVSGDAVVAGMTPATPETVTMRSVWAIYFQVPSCDATVDRVRGIGGRLAMVPQIVPGVGTFAFIADPAGAHFGVLQPADVA